VGASFLNKIQQIVDNLYCSTSASKSDMQKDFKIGLIIGVFLAIIGLIWLSTLPSLSITSRFRSIQNAQTNTIEGIINPSTASQNGVSPPTSSQEQQTKAPADSKSAEGGQTETISDQRFHIVLRGQTLSDIAKQYYGSASKWPKIRNANPSIDPDKLKPGTRLFIPP
jgi:LysM repeat protein